MESDSDLHMARRQALAKEFFRIAFRPDGGSTADPDVAWIADDTTFWDLDQEDADEVIERVGAHYGMTLTATDLAMPLWQLLDRLAAERREAEQ